MSGLGKAFVGWTLICLVIVFSGGASEGLATYVVGIGIWLLGAAIVEWINSLDKH